MRAESEGRSQGLFRLRFRRDIFQFFYFLRHRAIEYPIRDGGIVNPKFKGGLENRRPNDIRIWSYSRRPKFRGTPADLGDCVCHVNVKESPK